MVTTDAARVCPLCGTEMKRRGVDRVAWACDHCDQPCKGCAVCDEFAKRWEQIGEQFTNEPPEGSVRPSWTGVSLSQSPLSALSSGRLSSWRRWWRLGRTGPATT